MHFILVWVAAQVLLLQVTQIEGEIKIFLFMTKFFRLFDTKMYFFFTSAKYTSCKSHSDIVSALINLPDTDVLNCPTAIIGNPQETNCCFDRWGQRDGTFFCCNNLHYFFFEIL